MEAALYFCAVEAVQNASTHAPGAPVVVALDREGSRLALSVTDGGPGFDPDRAAGGSGLQNMADRLAAIGGELQVISSPGAGTAVRGSVPVPAAAPAHVPEWV